MQLKSTASPRGVLAGQLDRIGLPRDTRLENSLMKTRLPTGLSI